MRGGLEKSGLLTRHNDQQDQKMESSLRGREPLFQSLRLRQGILVLSHKWNDTLPTSVPRSNASIQKRQMRIGEASLKAGVAAPPPIKQVLRHKRSMLGASLYDQMRATLMQFMVIQTRSSNQFASKDKLKNDNYLRTIRDAKVVPNWPRYTVRSWRSWQEWVYKLMASTCYQIIIFLVSLFQVPTCERRK
jgi:hypothetical protein